MRRAGARTQYSSWMTLGKSLSPEIPRYSHSLLGRKQSSCMAENKKARMMRARTLEHFRATGKTFTGTYQDFPLPEEQREVGGPDKALPGRECMRTAM